MYGLCCICATDVTGDCQRVELAVPVTALPKKTVLKYDGQGCARMHSTCWNKVQNVSSDNILLAFLNGL